MKNKMDLVIESLIATGRYTKEEFQLLEDAFQELKLSQDEYLLQQGEVCSSFSFILDGALIQYQQDTDLNKRIIDLKATGEWIVDHKSFTTRNPSEYSIRSYGSSLLYQLSLDVIHRLIAQSQSFLQMGGLLDDAVSRVTFFDNNFTPDEKYAFLQKEKPEYLQIFPQTIIASYLKITPETLSRVRSRAARK